MQINRDLDETKLCGTMTLDELRRQDQQLDSINDDLTHLESAQHTAEKLNQKFSVWSHPFSYVKQSILPDNIKPVGKKTSYLVEDNNSFACAVGNKLTIWWDPNKSDSSKSDSCKSDFSMKSLTGGNTVFSRNTKGIDQLSDKQQQFLNKVQTKDQEINAHLNRSDQLLDDIMNLSRNMNTVVQEQTNKISVIDTKIETDVNKMQDIATMTKRNLNNS